jgi:hypothetical protein
MPLNSSIGFDLRELETSNENQSDKTSDLICVPLELRNESSKWPSKENTQKCSARL